MLQRIAAFLVISCSMFAQNDHLAGVSRQYKPGDTVRYTVAFDGDPKFDNVVMNFYSQSVPPNQSGLTNGFSIGRFRKTASGTFEVEGEIPPNVASGRYELANVSAQISPYGSKSYDAREFHEVLTVDNSARYEFPPLKSITPK
jgi:hypothetical protein